MMAASPTVRSRPQFAFMVVSINSLQSACNSPLFKDSLISAPAWVFRTSPFNHSGTHPIFVFKGLTIWCFS
jgi:hypothetical protein